MIMKCSLSGHAVHGLVLGFLMSCSVAVNAQTDLDAIMMTKKNFCVGSTYDYSSWDHYWEGTLKRDNQNLGTVSTQGVALMGTYGVSSRLNLLFSLPYLSTKATAGTLHGQKGIQDLSLWVKWLPVEKKWGPGTFSLYGIAGYSMPVTDYVADFQPLSLGLGSKNLSLRALVDYQWGTWFATASGTYVVRSNVKIDRDAYYTTEMHYTNEVSMPDATQFNFRTGWRSERFIAEAVLSNWTTLGGFDITRNNMPFPSNRMNATSVGLGGKYNIAAVDGLSLVGGGSYTVAGRNVGQTKSFFGGIFYILDFNSHHKTNSSSTTTQSH
jgi:hypothetical protein